LLQWRELELFFSCTLVGVQEQAAPWEQRLRAIDLVNREIVTFS